MSLYVVTGAGRGIGHEVCRQLRQRGETVVAACRRAVPELASLGCEVVDGVDVTDDASVARLVTALAGRRVDVLVNNAGILARESLDELDFEGMRRQFEVNALAPLRVTRALLPNLGEGSKVAIITSRMGSIADNGSGGYYGYRMSKAAVNMAGVSLSRDLGERGIAVLLLHPGMVATEMTGGSGIPVQQSAANLIARIDSLGLEQSGSFHHADGQPLPW
jgi:NAD(P)-dependent dehydrogenase (short-subunit alcohol dehydrogenase family)